MNETFEKIDFSQKKSEKFSFYEFTKNPPLNEEINFFEKFHISFNINNLILNNKTDEQEIETEMVENNENIQENSLLNKNLQIYSNNMGRDMGKYKNCEELKNGKVSINYALDEAIGLLKSDNILINIESNKDNKMIYDDKDQNDILNYNKYDFNTVNIQQNYKIKYNTNHEDFNNIEDYHLGHVDNYYTESSFPVDINTCTNGQKDLQKIPKEISILHEKSPSFSNKDVNNLSDKFNLFAHKQNIKTKDEAKKISNTHNNLMNNLNKNNYIHINKPDSSEKKIITKEFFSKQINSIGNIQADSQLAEIKELETKYGISHDAYGCPDYNSYSEDKLKEEMKKYGLKAASVKFMVKTLVQIWEFMNMSKF